MGVGTVQIARKMVPRSHVFFDLSLNGIINWSMMELSGVVMLEAAVRATVGARATVGDITTIDYCICYWGILAAAVSS